MIHGSVPSLVFTNPIYKYLFLLYEVDLNRFLNLKLVMIIKYNETLRLYVCFETNIFIGNCVQIKLPSTRLNSSAQDMCYLSFPKNSFILDCMKYELIATTFISLLWIISFFLRFCSYFDDLAFSSTSMCKRRDRALLCKLRKAMNCGNSDFLEGWPTLNNPGPPTRKYRKHQKHTKPLPFSKT